MRKTIILSLFYSQLGFLILLPFWVQLLKYLHPLAIGIVWFCFSAFITFFVFWLKKVTIIISKHIFRTILFVYSFGLLILLFFRPESQSYETVNLIPFETIYYYLAKQSNSLISIYNLAANIGLFIPFGLYYGYIKKNPNSKPLLATSICLISSIEVVQFLTKRGSLDIDDLLLNTSGVIMGYFIQPFFRKVLMIKEISK